MTARSGSEQVDVAGVVSDAGVTAALLRREIEGRIAAGFTLYNAGDEPIEKVQVSGLFYDFAPGVKVEIRPRYVHPRGGKFGTGPYLLGKEVEVDERGDALSIASNVLLRVAQRGVCLVYTNKDEPLTERDVRIIQAARERYLRYRLGRAKDVQAGWIAKCKVVAQSGGLPPAQTPYIASELRFLHDHEAGVINRKAFVVRLDGAEFDTMAEAVAYVAERYADAVRVEGGAPEKLVIRRDDVVAPAPPTAPSQAIETQPVPAVDANYILDEADKYDVRLTKAHMEGLLRGTKDVISDIVDLIDLAKLKAAKGGKK